MFEVDEPFSGQLTAIGFSPVVDRSVLKRFLSKIPLLGGKVELAAVKSELPAPCASSSAVEHLE